jgi:aspartyl-tRNA(Asn)/glutamyl-tRNA(Gln) amidotransferase subunit C
MIRRFFCTKINWKQLKHPTKVPQNVVKSAFPEATTRVKVTEDEIKLLEKLSLVDLERK